MWFGPPPVNRMPIPQPSLDSSRPDFRVLRGLPFSGDYPQPVRVVRSEELVTQNHYRQRQLQPETTAHPKLQ